MAASSRQAGVKPAATRASVFGRAGAAGEVDEGDGDAAGGGGVHADDAAALEGRVRVADGEVQSLERRGQFIDALALRRRGRRSSLLPRRRRRSGR